MATDFNISTAFNKMFNTIEQQGAKLQQQMNILSQQTEISATDLLKLQYEMGMYNTTLELLSTVTKSVTDELKNLAQRTS